MHKTKMFLPQIGLSSNLEYLHLIQKVGKNKSQA